MFMPKKYIVKTESGSLYEIEDHRHLMGKDQWFISIKGKKKKILGLMKLKKPLKEIDIFDFREQQIVYLEKGSIKHAEGGNTSPVTEIYKKMV